MHGGMVSSCVRARIIFFDLWAPLGCMGAEEVTWTQLAPVSRQATGSLRQETIVSQKLFCDPVPVFT